MQEKPGFQAYPELQQAHLALDPLALGQLEEAVRHRAVAAPARAADDATSFQERLAKDNLLALKSFSTDRPCARNAVA